MYSRCNIPVVIMGETGCGKTRLIRFMCDLAAQGCRQGGNEVRNMLIMKVKTFPLNHNYDSVFYRYMVVQLKGISLNMLRKPRKCQ